VLYIFTARPKLPTPRRGFFLFPLYSISQHSTLLMYDFINVLLVFVCSYDWLVPFPPYSISQYYPLDELLVPRTVLFHVL
jgi:hypothetical protein